jgi:hypothetical protein
MAKRTITFDQKEIERLIIFLENISPFNDNDHKKIIKKLNNALKPQIKVPSAKAKGRKLQYEVCEMIGRLLDIKFEPSNDDCPIKSRGMGQHGADCYVIGPDKYKFPFAVECKSSESFSFPETIEQAESNKGSYEDWIIVHDRKGFKEPLIIMTKYMFELIWKDVLYGRSK